MKAASTFSRVIRALCASELARYAAGVAALLALTSVAALSLLDAASRNAVNIAQTPAVTNAAPVAQQVRTDSAVLQSFEWGGSRRVDRNWSRSREYSRRDDDDDDDDRRDRSRRQRGLFEDWFGSNDEPRYSRTTYRTVCVRMCDGFATPVSFATSEGHFQKDALACASSCDAPAKLYVYRSSGESLENAVDLNGQPYAKLKTAFLFRTTYNESCRCRPQAWDQVSLDRHKVYAMEQELKKGKVADKQDAARKIASAKSELKVAEAASRETIRVAANAAYTAATGQPAPIATARLDRRQREIDDDGDEVRERRTSRSRADRAELERVARQARGAFAAPPMGLGGADRPRETPAPRGPAAEWTRKVYGY